MLDKIWTQLEGSFSDAGSFERVRALVPIFYYFVEFMSFGVLVRFSDLASKTPVPYWGNAWQTLLGEHTEYALHISLLIFFAGTFIAAVRHTSRTARIFAFLSIFQFQAYMVGLDGQANELYIPLFVSLLFIFLPSYEAGGAVALETRRYFNLLFWAAQAYILLTYAQSGFYKLGTTVWQAAAGQPHFFSPDAASLFISHWLVQYHNTTLLGPFLIEHPLIGWTGLLAGLYVLVFAIWAAFVPLLHRVWAIGIILFHFSTVVSMGLLFWFNTFFVMLMLGNSPFLPQKYSWRDVAIKLPVLGPLFGLIARSLGRL